jgi:hypothetical protein
MSLPEPNEYQMIVNLQAALLAIAIASGYYHDVAPEAVRLDANANVEALIGESQLRPFVLVNVLPDTRTYSPAMRTDIVTPIDIHWVNEPPDPDDASRMREFFRARGDVERVSHGPSELVSRTHGQLYIGEEASYATAPALLPAMAFRHLNRRSWRSTRAARRRARNATRIRASACC